MQHWELAHRLSIFSLQKFSTGKDSNQQHVACHRTRRGTTKHSHGVITRESILSWLFCRLIGNTAEVSSRFLACARLGQIPFNPMPTVLLCPPNYFDVVDQKNPYMSRESAVDRAKARTQWEMLCSVLQHNGCDIETVDPVEGLEDMVFAANQVFVGQKAGYGKFAVPSRMVYSSRHREVPFYADWFRAHDYQLIDLDYGDDYLEGHGDLLWHPDGSRIYAGYGFRSTLGGVEKFAAAMSKMGIPVVPLQLVDPYCYHLDTCLCPLNDEAALIFPGAYLRRGSRVSSYLLEARSSPHRR